MSYYDVAQVCLDGHVVNDSFRTSPKHNKQFCNECGKETITKCQHCGNNIKGYYYVDGIFDIVTVYHPPSYCDNCGKPFPWIETKLQAAINLINENETLDREDKEIFQNNINNITNENPKTQLASNRIIKVISKLPKNAYEQIYPILIDLGGSFMANLLKPGP